MMQTHSDQSLLPGMVIDSRIDIENIDYRCDTPAHQLERASDESVPAEVNLAAKQC